MVYSDSELKTICIPYSGKFKERIRITKEFKGQPVITVLPRLLIAEWR